jgi:GNAT superfamily N-acetyltransferase
MTLAAWWRGDPVPALSTLPNFRVQASHHEHLLARINQLTKREVRRRLLTGHQPYLAFLGRTPVGYGWMATQAASIGELGLRVELSAADRYLWDFATLPEWQGYGIYPRLLQGILGQLEPVVERVWIIHAPENTPSGAGMRKAGLLPVGQLSFRSDGGVGLAPLDAPERASAGAALLGIPLIEGSLAPCWRCGGATEQRRAAVAADLCWPPLGPTT